MRVYVDLDRCEGNGMRMLAEPKVFDLDDAGQLHYDSSPEDSLREEVEDAVANCPVSAITLDPEPGATAGSEPW